MYDLNEHPNADAGFRNFANAIGYVPPAMSVDTLRQERLATMARAYRDEDEGEGEEWPEHQHEQPERWDDAA